MRYQCARSLAIVERNATVRIDKARLLSLVTREVTVNRHVGKPAASIARGMATTNHFSRNWSVTVPVRALPMSSRCLRRFCRPNPCASRFAGCTPTTRGCAGPLEYLENVLPYEIRDRLWPFLEDRGAHCEDTALA